MTKVIIVLFDAESETEIKNAERFVLGLHEDAEPNLLIWHGLETLTASIKKRLIAVLGKSIYGLGENKMGFLELVKSLNPNAIHFCDTPELFIEDSILSEIYLSAQLEITENFFRGELQSESKKYVPTKFFFEDESSLVKMLPILKDFDMLSNSTPLKNMIENSSDQRIGMVVTFFKTDYNTYEELRKTILSLCFDDWYLVLATHSTIPQDIQEMCDLVVFESENIADQRKYSHGVAETSLIRKSLVALKDMGFNWTFKMCYDVEVADTSKIKEWMMGFRYDFVSCRWGDKSISTNSFFCNIDFTLQNLSFFESIEDMFLRSFFIEDIWEQDIKSKKLEANIYTFDTKDEMFGQNTMDTNSFKYQDIEFWYADEEKKFYLRNNGSRRISGKLSIVDYYSDLSIFLDEFEIGNGTMWIMPNPIFYLNELPKNGYYIEITDFDGNLLLSRNLNIKDFRSRHKFHKIFRGIRKDMARFCKDFKYPELVHFNKMAIYDKFKINDKGIRTFIDAGAHAGMFTLAALEMGAKKGYLIEPESRAFEVLKKNLNTGFLSVFRKALYKETGEVTLNIFSEHQTTNSIDETWQAKVKEKISVESITIDDFFRDHIAENCIDLFKIDIEGGEYDAFLGMSDETMKRCRHFLIEYHANRNMRVLELVNRLVKNGFSIMFDKYNQSDSENYLANDMGIIFASR